MQTMNECGMGRSLQCQNLTFVPSVWGGNLLTGFLKVPMLAAAKGTLRKCFAKHF